MRSVEDGEGGLGMLRCLIVALLLLSRPASAEGDRLVTTFRSVCVETLPGFEGVGARVEMLGGWLDPAPGQTISRVPFVLPDHVKQGGTGSRDMPSPEDMGVDYARGTAAGLPAAGCSVASRKAIDETSVARLLGGFKQTHPLGEHGRSSLGGPYRAWVVLSDGGRAVLTITEPEFAGEPAGASISLVRLDDGLIDRLATGGAVP